MSGRILVVTGTGTGVGKTVVTAALAAVATARGDRVAVLKPAQTGMGVGEPGDLADVARLVPGTTGRELARYPDPLAPDTAARRAGAPPVTPAAAADAAGELADAHDLVLVEGAGGLLVRFDTHGTLVDVAGLLAAPVLVVATAGLGTLNATELTVAALRSRELTCAGVVIGAWPATPDLASRCNLADLPTTSGVPLLGALPEGAGALAPERFATVARHSLAAELGGVWQTPQL
ncbi:dethiobiotin synthase [Pseudonocardia sp. MH-G8]|uniref:dethiobiotin synthase n=1 Tax=Pseudonocardia sp. MH-G8 TaxID=1854588 RepID=UPI001E433FC9|nr:dethiobiotin synthase [Pseudonocardia sp. MH-G8]